MIWLTVDGILGVEEPHFTAHDISPTLWVYYNVMSWQKSGSRAVTMLLRNGVSTLDALMDLYNNDAFQSIKGIGHKSAAICMAVCRVLLRNQDYIESAIPTKEEEEDHNQRALKLIEESKQ